VQGPIPREDVFRTYWRFAAERQLVFERRLEGKAAPWTEDEILQEYRFCNVFRASDRVSQALIGAAYAREDFSAEDLFLRVMLFRLFSRPETWELIEAETGLLTAANFDEEKIGRVLDRAFEEGSRLYTAAFILCATDAFGHRRKHRNHLALVASMLQADLPERLAGAPSLSTVYELLAEWPLIGPFMAYQLAIDFNYSPLLDFDENDFTVPGPGALRGLRKVFVDLGDLSPADAVHWLVDYQEAAEEELAIAPPSLFGRPLHAIDCQNLLCEVDKYCRVAFPKLESKRTRIKQRFRPNPEPLHLAFPPKWGIDALCR
jgi:alpha-glutamyl/putrescinyl thymine pyrophosphorylase clade 1